MMRPRSACFQYEERSAWAGGIGMIKSRLARRVIKGFILLTIVGVLGIGALLVSLWLERRSELTLPTLTGPFAVGRVIYAWADETTDTLAPSPATKRELLVWIWFPSAAGPSVPMDDYVPAQMR